VTPAPPAAAPLLPALDWRPVSHCAAHRATLPGWPALHARTVPAAGGVALDVSAGEAGAWRRVDVYRDEVAARAAAPAALDELRAVVCPAAAPSDRTPRRPPTARTSARAAGRARHSR
jgi:hypothetical protein